MESSSVPVETTAKKMSKQGLGAVIGDQMKGLERANEKNVRPDQWFIVRLDGHSFSKFTAPFRKPFDKVFVDAMVLTTNDLVLKHGANTGYCHSDEISLLFAPKCTTEELQSGTNKSVHPFNGRLFKTLTLLAAYTSVRFNTHLLACLQAEESNYDNKEQYERLYERISRMEAIFDARALVLPREDANSLLVDHMWWRSVYDSNRNAISTYARHVIAGKPDASKMLKNKNSYDMKQIMIENGLNWQTNVPLFLKHGVYAKKELYRKEALDYKTKQICQVTRSRVSNYCFKLYRRPDSHYTSTELDQTSQENKSEVTATGPVDMGRNAAESRQKITVSEDANVLLERYSELFASKYWPKLSDESTCNESKSEPTVLNTPGNVTESLSSSSGITEMNTETAREVFFRSLEPVAFQTGPVNRRSDSDV